jgi:AcrR family transcriptional regulator
MKDAADTIAARLEEGFDADGFTEPGVDALRERAAVSLRTLYKHFPSREAMVIGALDNRHRSYLAWLDEERPETAGAAPIRHLFDRLAIWMAERSPQGCLFMRAIAAHPHSAAIRETVDRHKAETRKLFLNVLARAFPRVAEDTRATAADSLLLVHEGQTALSVSRGAQAAAEASRPLVEAILTDLENS